MTKAERLMELKSECLACRKCSIGGKKYDGNIGNVFSNMCLKARIMVVGQNPGSVEVEKGVPFIGPSGKFFDKAVKDVLGLDRSSFYISNCVHCFTRGNRTPTNDEIENCQPFLEREIKIVDPILVITLGNPSLFQLTGRNGISKVHGQLIQSLRYKVVVLPLYHPSPLNMNRTGSSDSTKTIKDMFYEDLAKIGEV